ncbi:hypothetical protein CK203_110566 [Vitis vinifera]|uniref:Reverse transcriptase/retrotransposon-derived protein RNase H-like domain-containing protein n=1 Tax=Vitis vinifera TaxID=29760 RepID=A0A438CQ78_VITVI|nr:hypothetical protein CK203_110566 [Vitis vinifera]
MMSAQPHNRSWSLANQPRTTWLGIPKPRTNEGNHAGARRIASVGPVQSHPLNVLYEKLLPMIHELSYFKWPEPLKMDPAKRDRNRKCAYHKKHGHTTEWTLSGFNEASTTSLGDIVLPVQAGPVILNVQFSMVANLSPFNAILGCAWLHGMKATPSTYHQMVSYLTKDGSLLEANKARCLKGTLQQNKDVFAWTHSNMPEIHSLIASHQLNILPSSRRIRQKVRRFHPDRFVALGRFIAWFTNKLKPFFLVLKGASVTGWTKDCQSAFEEIKHYLTQPPILSSPQPGKRLYIKAMADTKTRCSMMEQMALALRSAAQKLRSYFQAHPIVVLTNQPLKRQVMVDFIAEVPQESLQLKEPGKEGWWTLHVDGAFQSLRSRVGLLLQSSTGEQLE